MVSASAAVNKNPFSEGFTLCFRDEQLPPWGFSANPGWSEPPEPLTGGAGWSRRSEPLQHPTGQAGKANPSPGNTEL